MSYQGKKSQGSTRTNIISCYDIKNLVVGLEIMCEKWVEFPYFPYFNKNDMQFGGAPNEFIGLNIMIYYFLFDI